MDDLARRISVIFLAYLVIPPRWVTALASRITKVMSCHVLCRAGVRYKETIHGRYVLSFVASAECEGW